MTDTATALTIRASENGVIRVFAMNMPAEQAQFQRDPQALEQILGTADIDLDHVQIFPVSDLDQLGLTTYLTEGCGVPASTIATDQTKLLAVTGHVMLIFSRAFGGRAVTLTPAPPLALIARYTVPGTDWSGDRIDTQSAQLYTSKHTAPRQVRAETRRLGAIVFGVFMLILMAIVLVVVL